MTCYLHTDREPSAECVSCHQRVCQECDVVLARRHYCKKCLAEAERVVMPEAIVSSSGGAMARGIKRMFRSREDRVIAGVCGGFARYAEIDPAIVRIVYMLMVLLTTGFALLAYPIAVLAIPSERFLERGEQS
jgi:phage shock protein C